MPRVFSSSATAMTSMRLPPLVERQHRLEDLAVHRQEEVVDLQRRRDLVERRRLDEDRAQHRLLGLEVVRRGALAPAPCCSS